VGVTTSQLVLLRGSWGRRTIVVVTESLHVWVDQDLCTGDGLCVQYAPEVFEFDVDGLAYVKDGTGTLLGDAGARADVPDRLRLDVIDSANDCPGACIHVVRASNGEEVAGPDA
jgi:ferredoxin